MEPFRSPREPTDFAEEPIFVDEIDTTSSLDFTDDFFVAIRSLHERRAQNTNLDRLSFVLLGVATPGDLITDAKRTPFNIGVRLDLEDFEREEARPFGRGLGVDGDEAEKLLDENIAWTRGHPYLTQCVCAKLADLPVDQRAPAQVARVVAEVFFEGLGSDAVNSKLQDFNLQSAGD